MAACSTPGCTWRAFRGLTVCPGCFAIGVVDGALGSSPTGTAGRVARAVVDGAGPDLARLVSAFVSQSGEEERAAAPAARGMELLLQLGFRNVGLRPLQVEVEAFRKRMARAFHEDAGEGPVDPEMMARINNACDEVIAGCKSKGRNRRS